MLLLLCCPRAAGAKGTERAQGRTSGRRQQGDYLWAFLLAWQPEGQQREKDKEEVRISPGITARWGVTSKDTDRTFQL